MAHLLQGTSFGETFTLIIVVNLFCVTELVSEYREELVIIDSDAA
jgi:hypothetical protein